MTQHEYCTIALRIKVLTTVSSFLSNLEKKVHLLLGRFAVLTAVLLKIHFLWNISCQMADMHNIPEALNFYPVVYFKWSPTGL